MDTCATTTTRVSVIFFFVCVCVYRVWWNVSHIFTFVTGITRAERHLFPLNIGSAREFHAWAIGMCLHKIVGKQLFDEFETYLRATVARTPKVTTGLLFVMARQQGKTTCIGKLTVQMN